MKYEEIKIGDFYKFSNFKEEVIAKVDKRRLVVTADEGGDVTTWHEGELERLKPLKEQLPEEGLLVSRFGTLAYRLSGSLGYGFSRGQQSGYLFNNKWKFSLDDHWKPATPEQENKFIEMLKKECEKRGLFEDTKLSKCGINSYISINKGTYSVIFELELAWNRNGRIFYKGKFATPRKETTLELVSKAAMGIGDFIVEQTESGVIILTPLS